MLKSKPEPHQVEAVELMKRVKRFCLADGTGKGKTFTALAAFAELKRERPERRMLVLANVGSLPTWADEVPKHTDLSAAVGGSSDYEAVSHVLRTSDPDVIVLSYPSVRPRSTYERDASGEVVGETLHQGKYWEEVKALYAAHSDSVVLVLEEAHYCQSHSTKLYMAVSRLVAHSEYAWMLTATPINGRIEDLYYLMDVLIPGFFGTKSDFMKRYTVRELRRVSRTRKAWHVVGYQRLDELKEKLSGYMLKRALDMDVRFRTAECRLTPEEEERYLLAARGILDETEGVRDFGARTPDLQLVVDNAVLEGREPNRRRELGSKERLLLEGLRESFEADGKCVVVSCYFVLTFRRLKFVLESAAGKLGFDRVLTIEADHTTEERRRAVRDFGPGDVLLMSSAGKESLNLGQSDELWMYNVLWSARDAMQTVGRITRMDSEHESFEVVLPLAAGTIDEYKKRVWEHKAQVFAKVLTPEASMIESEEEVTMDALKALREELLWKTGR